MGRASFCAVLLAATALAGCGPDWQPSWNMSSTPEVEGDSLTVARVTGQEVSFTPLQREHLAELRLSVGALLNTPPAGPAAAMSAVPDYRPVPRPDIDTQTRRPGSSTPPEVLAPPTPPAPAPRRPTAPALPPAPSRVEGTPVQVPGEPAGVVTSGTERVQSYVQPNTAGGGVTVRDGGTTTVIQPGGRVTTIPTPR